MPSSSFVSELVYRRALPLIHVLSDVHLETGPYEIPVDLKCDIVVAAGDIGPVELAVPWLAALGKPVVYVLGNHERYGATVEGAVLQAKELAKGTQVTVLENQAAVVGGVRFLGATLWTSYGGWSRPLVHEALRRMNDFHDIALGDWLSAHPARQKEFWALCQRADLVGRGFIRAQPNQPLPEKFHPAVAYMLHQRSVRWLSRELAKHCELPTVVVSHHAPSFAALAGKQVGPELLVPAEWDRYRRHDKLVYVAAYASDLNELLRQRRDALDLWVHGHVHAGQDLLVEGVRLLCNPRGRYVAPLTEESAKSYAFFGMRVSAEDIARSQAAAQREPFRGSADGFDANLVVDLSEGPRRPLERLCEPVRARMQELREDAQALIPFVGKGHPVQADAVARCMEANVEEFGSRARAFDRDVFTQLDRYGMTHGLSSQGAHVSIPYLPWRKEEWTEEALRRVPEYAQEWLEYLLEVPRRPELLLREWARCALQGLDLMHARGLKAYVVRPSTGAMRRLDEKNMCFVVPSLSEEDSSQAPEPQAADGPSLEMALDELINGRPPRAWFIRVQAQATDWHGRPLRRLWERSSLSAFLAR